LTIKEGGKDKDSANGIDRVPSRASETDAKQPKKGAAQAKGTEPFERWEREEMEKLLKELRGHLGERE
jgi:phospholipase D1/2